MADSANTTQANAPATSGVPDRVAMLSLRADGTAEQSNPEFIGNKEHALEATKRQFATQATSAADVAARVVAAAENVAGEVETSLKPLVESHQKAVAAAESAAEKVVAALTKNA